MLYAGLDLSRKRLDFHLLNGEGATVERGAAPPDADGLQRLSERVTRPLGNRIGRITVDGVVTNFVVPTSNSRPDGIAVGPDGALWFTERLADKIGRLTTAGLFTEFPLPPFALGARRPAGITAGPDGSLWISEVLAKSIARLTLDGVVTEFPVPSGAGPAGITAAPDGSIWFSEPVPAIVGRLDVGGPRQAGKCKDKD
jgi:virginiamycin B lyase